MADLSGLYNKRLGPITLPGTGGTTTIGSINLANISDGDSMFLVRASCMAFRIATTTAYPETAFRSVAVTRHSDVYAISPLIEGLPGGDNDIGPTSYGTVISGAYTEQSIPGQVVFSFSLLGSILRLEGTNTAGSGRNTTARAYVQIMVNDP